MQRIKKGSNVHVLGVVIIVLLVFLLLRDYQLQRLQAVRISALERERDVALAASRNQQRGDVSKTSLATDTLLEGTTAAPQPVFRLNLTSNSYPSIDQFLKSDHGIYAGLEYHVVSKRAPRAMLLKHTITKDDAAEIIEHARSRIERSRVVGMQSSVVSQVRTSNGMFILTPLAADTKLREHVAAITGVPLENCEATQVLRYLPGQFYRPHPDYFTPGSEHLNRGGQRFVTVLTWLNEIPPNSGGETRFPFASPAVTVKQTGVGDSVMFYSTDENGVVDFNSNHEGVPPSEGAEKWVAVVWVRQQKFV